MKSKNFYLLILAILLLAGCKSQKQETSKDYTIYVDPLIGSGYHGHVFVGANVPFGMVQVGATNISKGWDWCSGYHESDSTIIGFAQTHLSGTGIGELGDILFMPTVGTPSVDKNEYLSTYKPGNQTAEAGYYRVLLDNGVDVELTATARVGYHRYKFPAGKQANVILDLCEGIGWDAPAKTYVKQLNDTRIEGYRFSKGWAEDDRIYFVAEFSEPILNMEVIEGEYTSSNGKYSVPVDRAIIGFREGTTLEMKVAVSYTSIENAAKNLAGELPGWDFAATRTEAKRLWNKELAKFDAQSSDPAVMRTFYTALYHTMISPILFMDITGDYRGADGKTYKAEGFIPYSIFSLWDTYRTQQPLSTIIHTDKVNDFINSFLAIYEQQGKLPMWHLVGNETNCMVGYSAVPVIADAYLKGFRGFDAQKALEAMKATANTGEFGLNYLKELGYIPCDKEVESVAKALEYAIADNSIAKMARAMGKEEDYKEYAKRAKYYQRYFDKSVEFMRGVTSSGKFNPNFNPFHSIHREDDYTEGNAWQYTWLVPHDVAGLVELFGSEERFVNKLDSLFTVPSELNEGASADITGLIGQYAHGNEPSHATLYLYPYVGQQWKTAEKVHQVFTEFYKDTPDGIIGNEDCGQMSAWYIMSAMGFYPVDPAGGNYVFGTPLMESLTINLENGKKFEVTAQNLSRDNFYIQSVELNGKPYTKSYITHNDIMSGGKLKYVMGSAPNREFGASVESRP